jgi:hypothetical protein
MRASATRRFAILITCASICLSTACTTLRPVPADPGRIRAEVKVGDTVRAVTADGTTHSFRVSAVGESSLVGNAVRSANGGTDAVGSRIELPYQDIRELDTRRVSGAKSTALAAVVVLAAAVAIASGGGSHTIGYNR